MTFLAKIGRTTYTDRETYARDARAAGYTYPNQTNGGLIFDPVKAARPKRAPRSSKPHDPRGYEIGTWVDVHTDGRPTERGQIWSRTERPHEVWIALPARRYEPARCVRADTKTGYVAGTFWTGHPRWPWQDDTRGWVEPAGTEPEQDTLPSAA